MFGSLYPQILDFYDFLRLSDPALNAKKFFVLRLRLRRWGVGGRRDRWHHIGEFCRLLLLLLFRSVVYAIQSILVRSTADPTARRLLIGWLELRWSTACRRRRRSSHATWHIDFDRILVRVIVGLLFIFRRWRVVGFYLLFDLFFAVYNRFDL